MKFAEMEVKIKPTSVIVLIGKRGGGKTTVIRYIVRECDFSGTVIYDGNADRDYDKERDFRDSDNVTIIRRKFTDPAWDSFGEKDGKGKFVIIDELDMVNLHHRDFYKEWINTGRHWPSGGVVAGRRPTMLPRDVTANADLTFIFRAKERSVQDFIKSSYTDEVATEAARLKKYEFLVVDASEDLICKAILTEDGKRLVVLQEYTSDNTPEGTETERTPPSRQNEAVPPGIRDRRGGKPTYETT